MATRSPGRPSARGGTKSGTRSKAGSSSKTGSKSGNKTGTRPKTGSKPKTAGAKSGTGTTSRPKTKTAPKTSAKPSASGGSKAKSPAKSASRPARRPAGKKKTARKSDSFLARHRSYILGMSLGLVLGCLAAVITFYLPKIGPGKHPAPPAARQSTPAPVEKSASPPPAYSAESRMKIVYEEKQRLETQIKTLDQGLYSTLKSFGIKDHDIDFKTLTPQSQGDRQWDHAIIEVALPAGVAAAQVVKGFQEQLPRLNLSPRPTLSVVKNQKGVTAEVEFDGMHTHTLELLARAEPKAHDVPAPPKVPVPPPGLRPRVAIVIDDFGVSAEEARCFLNLKFPVALSILPFLDQSQEVARMAQAKGRDIMLHMPMQPREWPAVDAGPGVLLVSMDEKEIKARARAALKAVPHIVGVNNHMGSRFTEDAQRMDWVLGEIKEQNLFFLDSLTSSRSQGYNEARRLGLITGRRTIFLDNVKSIEAIRIQLKRLVAHARQSGWAIGIGHVYPVTCQALKSEYNYLKTQVDLVPITTLLQPE